jgi:hypothetical protein
MTTFNPYEAPQSAFVASTVEADDLSGPWRDGKDLVTRKNSQLPDRCVKCNAAARTPLKSKRYYWHNSAWYLLILVNMFVYIVAVLIVRKNACLGLGLCVQHARRRSRMIAASLTCLGGSAALFVYALGNEAAAPLYLPSGLLLLAAMVIGVVGVRIVHPKRICERYARFSGCGSAFLDSLPRFRGVET